MAPDKTDSSGKVCHNDQTDPTNQKRGSCYYGLFPTEATIVAKPTKKSNSAPGGGDLRRRGGVLRRARLWA